ncbi:MAG: DUF2975 domain-containing protein [Alkalibacterium sp.]|nr:DUF2975 domain-containing protein [Alkalibacterium sp.]
MNIKQFRIICKVSSVLLKLTAAFLAISVVTSLYAYFFTDTNIWFNLVIPDFPLRHSGMYFPSEAEQQLAALIEVPFSSLLAIYVFWKGGQLFKYLSEGQSPFSFKFAKSIKWLALILMISDIFLPLFRSMLVTLIMEEGYYFLFGVGSSLMIGLILYAVSEIFNYGIELQRLSDETV